MPTYILLKCLDDIYSPIYPIHTRPKNYHQQRKTAIKNYREHMIKYYAQQHFKCTENIEFAYHKQGKPYIIGNPFAFNHSHSQQISALLMSDDYIDVGIDIEQLNRKVRFEAMAEHCFHADEWDLWQKNGKTASHWFKIWTVKEAVLKASGLGIRLNLNELNTQIQPNSQQGQIFHPKIGYFQFECMPCCLLASQNRIDFMLAVAWRISHDLNGQTPKIYHPQICYNNKSFNDKIK